jgi:hypothetical protein
MILEKYSIGIGDRFGRQGKAQLNALIKAQSTGLDIVPVWNKSFREHGIIGTTPSDVRSEADQAVAALNWTDSYYVDADHINLGNVDTFIEGSDFFTLDVADYIGQKPNDEDVDSFMEDCRKYMGHLHIPGIDETLEITEDTIRAIAQKFLCAAKEAGRIYRHIVSVKGADNFITEVSTDESDEPQTPVELFFILAALAHEKIPAQTIAPKFTGRFNKGVDYVGNVRQFEKEFHQDIAVIHFAVKEFSLPENLKLSVHSGSDKFSLYGPINQALKKFNAGLHLKTAGTTWLEELIGLAEAGGEGLEIAREVYSRAFSRFDEICAPYQMVIDIDPGRLPDPRDVCQWDGLTFAGTLRHDQSSSLYNPHFRQLLHVGYKIAADLGPRYLDALRQYEQNIAVNVTKNLYERHILPVFVLDK